MKKALIFMGLLAFACCGFAAPKSAINTTGAQANGIYWGSPDAQHPVTISLGDYGTFDVVISVDAYPGNTGVNISGCGAVTHIDAGSTAICPFSSDRGQLNTIKFASDSSTTASGSYTILK